MQGIGEDTTVSKGRVTLVRVGEKTAERGIAIFTRIRGRRRTVIENGTIGRLERQGTSVTNTISCFRRCARRGHVRSGITEHTEQIALRFVDVL